MTNPRIAKIKTLMAEKLQQGAELKAAHHQRLKKSLWKPAGLIRRLQPSAKALLWMTTKKSLTSLIKMHCLDLQVIVLSEKEEQPLLDECQALGISPQHTAWVRCVLLKCAEHDWLYARTVVPQMDNDNPWYNLQQLGETPLGEVLFDLPNIQRSPFEFCALPYQHWPHLQQRHLPQKGFARRSCFYQRHAPILLTEVFLPPILEKSPSN